MVSDVAGRPNIRTLIGVLFLGALWLLSFAPQQASAVPNAHYVIDARTGEVFQSYNSDTRLHPASLTKMMTLYLAFQAMERGEITADTPVTITSAASSEPPSKLGLRTGQQIRFRYLIRAAAVKSANDAATAIGIALEGSEEAFAARMNRMAQSMGMTRTTFRNANGLTQSGHLSTARDMSVLGRHVVYDFPQYYNIFSRTSTDAGMATVYNTNRRFLGAYRGADGIKTGFTNAAGYNLVASAQRGNVRIIAVVMGSTSTPARNAKAAELLDVGFARAPNNARIARPPLPAYSPGNGSAPIVTANGAAAVSVPAGKIIRTTGAVLASARPVGRAMPNTPMDPDEAQAVAQALAAAMAVTAEVAAPTEIAEAVVEPVLEPVIEPVIEAVVAGLEEAPMPRMRPAQIVPAEELIQVAAVEPDVATDPADIAAAVAQATTVAAEEPVVVTRVSTSGGQHWGINVGRYNSRYEAERILVRVALNEMSSLDGTVRRVVQSPRGFDANFMGMTRERAELACRRLQARDQTCFMVGQAE
ncbi:D-alanyl-D-alanine carboxypeptidase [Marivivens donghaensis]|uniref:D-alanyl-D-alanine carboxypeptidase n=1 Tax=Marivivens donghaensis TaxID=1699413 RepID=A0ABX0W0L6_9RHOB|nr:D-alanyl-D-alanine carboxypeptidase family protein [Marivivens donghaensis]NIY73623.1 D-alanyl-D-alanine carboxypeptidase [Marivivens donghaensis]